MLNHPTLALTFGSLLVLTGCGGSSTSTDTASADSEDFLSDFLKEIDLAEKPLPEKSAQATSPNTDDSENPSADSVDVMTVSATADPETPRSLTDSVKETLPASVAPVAGTRFSLVKTTEQTLVQKSATNPATATNNQATPSTLMPQRTRLRSRPNTDRPTPLVDPGASVTEALIAG